MNSIDAHVRGCVERGLLNEAPHAIVVYDLAWLRERLASLRAAFPPDTRHTLALKACPLSALLRRVEHAGFGAESASRAELEHALRLKFPPERVVFDSPAKTEEELEFALMRGVDLNADSLQELDRIAAIRARLGAAIIAAPRRAEVGVRVNPGLRPGRVGATSTAVPGAKFGVALPDEREALFERFDRYDWLTGVHVHSGSQGGELSLLVDAVERAAEFAAQVDARAGGRRVRGLDLGGGLSVAYRSGEIAPGFAEYADALRTRVPSLFDGRWRLTTEFGRAVWANAAIALSRVEYTKESHGRPIAVQHLGADMFLRPAYAPEQWSHRLSVYGPQGAPKTGAPVAQDVAGPLCFSGDLLARGRALPRIEPGDVVAIHDVGAYTLSMWSRYNSRQSPAVFGVDEDPAAAPELLRAVESVDDVLRFWE